MRDIVAEIQYAEDTDRRLREAGWSEREIDRAYIRNIDKNKAEQSILKGFYKVMFPVSPSQFKKG
jgi:hypothetical protein